MTNKNLHNEQEIDQDLGNNIPKGCQNQVDLNPEQEVFDKQNVNKVLQTKSAKKFVLRVIIYVVGLIFIGLGVAFAINSNLGISAASSLPYIIYLATNIPLSVTITLTYAVWVILQWCILGKKFAWYNVFQLIFSTIFGYSCDLWKLVLGGFCFPTYFGQLGMLAIAVILIAFGVFLYVEVDLLPLPVEGLALAITKKQKKFSFSTFKILVDVFMVISSIILSLIVFGKVVGIREGTVILALTVGLVIKLLQRPLRPLLRKICF